MLAKQIITPPKGMKTIRNIIFDFDGTLADTTPLIIATMHRTISELGLRPKTYAECRATIGLRLEEIPSVLWPGEAAAEEFAATYRLIFDQLERPLPVKCFPGVIDTIKKLHQRGFGIAIASSRNRASLLEYVELFGIKDFFSIIIGGDDVSRGKPFPEPVNKILSTCGWDKEETLIVGDTSVDILMGKNAGTLTCAVTYGNGTPEELAEAKPTYTASSFAEISRWVH